MEQPVADTRCAWCGHRITDPAFVGDDVCSAECAIKLKEWERMHDED